MASITTRANGRRFVQFMLGDARKTIQLGTCSMKAATTVRNHVEAILAARQLRVSLDPETAAWVMNLPDDMRQRIAVTGLVEGRTHGQLGPFVAWYIESRGDLTPGSRRHLQAGADHLVTFFGADRDLRAITPSDADAWLVWLQQAKPAKGGDQYAKSTIGRTVKRAKEIFVRAVRRRLIADNPFEHLRASEDVIKSRRAFVSRETIQAVIDAAPSVKWKLVFALARFAGLRCPGDMGSLTWDGIDWAGGTLVVMDETKTGFRRVPIFPELRKVLDEAWEQAKEGEPQLLPGLTQEHNLHTDAVRVIARAGLDQWPKLFNNLRASCETEWLRKYPIHRVAAWLGHSPAIALRHYATMELEDFEEFRTDRPQLSRPEMDAIVATMSDAELADMLRSTGAATRSTRRSDEAQKAQHPPASATGQNGS